MTPAQTESARWLRAALEQLEAGREELAARCMVRAWSALADARHDREAIDRLMAKAGPPPVNIKERRTA